MPGSRTSVVIRIDPDRASVRACEACETSCAGDTSGSDGDGFLVSIVTAPTMAMTTATTAAGTSQRVGRRPGRGGSARGCNCSVTPVMRGAPAGTSKFLALTAHHLPVRRHIPLAAYLRLSLVP